MAFINHIPVNSLAAPRPEGDLEEVLYHGVRTRVVRVAAVDGSDGVIIKEPRGPGAAARIRHEQSIIERLAGVEGIPRLAAASANAGTIMLEDTGGTDLATRVSQTSLDLPELLDLALSLTRTVAAVHRRGVVHKDINPANIVISGTPPRPSLIDFDLASTFAEDRPGFTHQSQVAGTLAYLAPEQTGRTGRAVDQRADLYSLGATLYALVTDGPPFGDGDPLELIHAHLARVPTPPAQVNPSVPAVLSDILLRLLEKEPDRRYQSADGLAYDLSRLRDDYRRGDHSAFALCERDFPLRLSAPSRLIGRESEEAILRNAFQDVARGRRRTVLVTGAPGVGKTALIDELRPIATAGGGWFVTGKFDQYRRDADSDGVRQALRALGRLLLAEPDAELTVRRTQILSALGPNAGLIATLLPEFGPLLGVAPAELGAADPLEAEARVVQAGIDLLRAIASPSRPVVMVLDDLQWAAPTPIALIDAAIMDDSLGGLLLVGAYRDGEVDAAHPLSPKLTRWERLSPPPQQLRLHNLPRADLGVLLAEMLRLRPTEASDLAEAVAARTDGNPYDTVELINGLRQEAVLVPGERGWSWDAATIRGYVGQGDVVDLLATRIDRLAPDAREILQVMACLGGQVELGLLQAASGLPAAALEERLVPSLEDGLLVLERRGDGAVRFRHDRVQQAAHGTLDAHSRRRVHLNLARRLATLPDLSAAAAEQYLSAVDAVTDPDERQRAAVLFRTTAANIRLINPAMAERFLAEAISLLSTVDLASVELLVALETERHGALYSLGRLDEADDVYASIERRCGGPLERAEAAGIQISSLSSRNHQIEALNLGLDLLRLLGLTVPDGEQVGVETERGMDALYRWLEEDSQAADLQRPEVSDPRAVAVAKLINRVLPPAYYTGQPIMAWLVVEAWRLWAEHGPCAWLVGPISHAGFVAIMQRDDYRTGYRALRRVLAASEARGYEPQTSQARFLFSIGTGHWFEPLEDNVVESRRAHEGLQRRGDMQNACCTYYASIPELLECAPTIDGFSAEVDAGLAFALRVGNDQAAAAYVAYRQLARALRGETHAPGSFNDVSFDEATYLATLTTNPTAAAVFHTFRALAAAVFNNAADLADHAAAVTPLLPFICGTYPVHSAYVVRALALADQVRAAASDERPPLLAEFDACRDWLAARAADAPANFGHLLRLVEAERASATGGDWAAISVFEEALREVEPRQRTLHRALIAERAARFHLARGLDHSGRPLLAEALRWYEIWGAAGKVRELKQAHPFLRALPDVERKTTARPTFSVSSGTIDLLGVVRASQALSSETSIDRLRLRVVDVLSTMTGATAVWMLLRDDALGPWYLPAAAGSDGTPIFVEDAGSQGLMPVSALRYVERTGEPLLVDDATRDDRFARDPYIAGLDACSLLVVPILTRGVLRAVLLLENRLSHGAFSAERLDAVMLIAGQLAVSLDNALVYALLEDKVAQRTEALAAANAQLETLSITDPLTSLPNRRRMAEVLQAHWQRALRLQGQVAVAMIDIDHFKSYNDRYGHVAGDTCLQRVATALSANIRDEDTVARYGGEEFAVILPDADAAAAYALAERVRATVQALDEPHAASPAGTVTVSIGVAVTVPRADTTVEDLIKCADALLYEAKRNGRNQVVAG